MQKIKQFVYHQFLIFSFLGVLFIPFSFNFSAFQAGITKFIFLDFILLIVSEFKSLEIVNPEITSDSLTMYFLFFLLFMLSVFLTGILSFVSFWIKNRFLVLQLIQLILVYYLALILLKYGFDKVFKVQFYFPEPNILYTPFGMLDKDILFWSTIGTSRLYNIFIGFSEIIAAFFLMYNRTRVLGLCCSLLILISIVFINFGFDISVKLYSLYLLFICFLSLSPFIKTLFQFFVLNATVTLHPVSVQSLHNSRIKNFVLKSILLIFFFIESLLPFIQSGNFNDDTALRNYLHGAYEVIEMRNNKQSTANSSKIYSSNLKIYSSIKRIFIHRQNYFIIQYQNDTMEDFYLKIDSKNKKFILTNYEAETFYLNYFYSENSKLLQLSSSDLGFTIYTKVLNWHDLPIRKSLFHWTVDEVK